MVRVPYPRGYERVVVRVGAAGARRCDQTVMRRRSLRRAALVANLVEGNRVSAGAGNGSSTATDAGRPGPPAPGPPLPSEQEPTVARLRAALDLVAEGVVVYDERGEPVARNAPAARYLSDAPSEALVVDAVDAVAVEALRGGHPEKHLDLRSPQRRDLVVRAFPLRGPAGLEGAVVTIEDVSERLRLESIRRDFVANVSHELKTPVGALSLLAETLDGEEDSDVVARLAGRVGAEAERLVRIIDDLLDLSRIEANEQHDTEPVRVREVLAHAVEPLRPMADSSGITLVVGETPEYLTVPGDRRDLVSAVGNLVENAIKYSEPGSCVDVRVEATADEVAISVADQGVGIPARDLERVFERFYRVDRARSRATGGTGLGLSIVRHVAVNHGGSVDVRSVEGEGSTFTLRLPASGARADRGGERSGA